MELALFGAWQMARLTTYGGKELKPLRDYLAELRGKPKRQQTAEEMIAAMRAVKALMADSAAATPPLA